MSRTLTTSIQVLDGANDITALIDWRSFDLVMVLTKEKGTLAFDCLLPKAPTLPANLPVNGDTITVKYTQGGVTTTIFGGTVVALNPIVEGGKLLRYKIQCQDWGFKFDSKLVKKSYANQDPQDIVKDIITTFAGSGFTSVNVKKGNFLVTSIKFNYEQPTKCIEALAKQIGWDWYIDTAKDVHFFPAGAGSGISAPFQIDDTGGHIDWPTLDVQLDLSNMKNSIYVVGGTYTKTFASPPGAGQYSPVDVYTTVAGQFVYQLAFPYDQATMTINLGGVSQTIGTDQQTPDGSVQVQYNNTGTFIRFTADPGAGHTIQVLGNARVPILAHLTNQAAITAYGEYQDSIIDQQIKSINEAQERAASEILQFGAPVYQVQFNSIDDLAGTLYVGQSIILNSTIFGIANQYLVIRRIEVTCQANNLLTFAVTATGNSGTGNGGDTVTFTDMMLFLLQQANAQNSTPDNTVLEILLTFSEALTIGETMNAPVTGTSPYKYGPNTPQPRYNFSRYA